MREALFIKKNKDRWTQIDHDPASDPDEMASDFIELVDDLSYAKTFYPSSKTTRYLNVLASRMYTGIYKNRKEEGSRLKKFFLYDLPLTVRRHHLVMLISLCIFSLFFVVGVYSSRGDEGFIRGIMGDSYVNQTEENIASGHPFGIFGTGDPLVTWLGIMKHNIEVSVMMLAGGLLLGLYPIYMLIYQGVEIGAFEAMFAQKGLAGDFVLTVFIHGTLEISALIITGAAGIVLGLGYVFPGTRSRLDSFKRGAKDACMIIVGLFPVFITAAFFEGYVTRHTEMPLILKLIILSGSLTFILGYFVVYPIWLEKKGGKVHV